MSINPLQLAKIITHVHYPAKKNELVVAAEEQGADERTIETISELPQVEFLSASTVAQAIGDIK